MAYVHRKDLASAWLKSFFGLDVQIKGELTLEVEWRAGTDNTRLEQPSTLTKLRSILTTLRARYRDGENPISKITCRIRDVRVYAPPPSRPKTEKCLQVDTLVLRFRCPSRTTIP